MSPIILVWCTTAFYWMFMYLLPYQMVIRSYQLGNMFSVLWMSRNIQLIIMPNDLMWKYNPWLFPTENTSMGICTLFDLSCSYLSGSLAHTTPLFDMVSNWCLCSSVRIYQWKTAWLYLSILLFYRSRLQMILVICYHCEGLWKAVPCYWDLVSISPATYSLLLLSSGICTDPMCRRFKCLPPASRICLYLTPGWRHMPIMPLLRLLGPGLFTPLWRPKYLWGGLIGHF